ncbi:MAG: phosphatidylglycerophosphatase A [Acidobacteriota bacterium]
MKRLLSSWFYSGYFPFASGTAGTAATIPLVLLLWWFDSWLLHLAAVVVLFAIGVWSAWDAETLYGKKDPGQVVIDETVGYLVSTLFVPGNLFTLGASFFLFRLMDVIKPPPARQLESLKGAWGIMADDVMAGIYANLVLQAILHYWTS